MGRISRMIGVGLLAGASLGLAACSESPAPPTASDPATSAADMAEAAAYCEQEGGEVQQRQPAWRTNLDEDDWVPLGDPIAVCRFQTLEDEADSRIYVDLVTISSDEPTLAALAYLSRTGIPDDPPGNPASALCSSLGGTTSFGPSAGGGGLTAADDPDDPVVAPCTFADGSFIDEWGIAYYAEGTVRGIDLSSVFRFDGSTLPEVFRTPSR
ncbi:DUF333 domain-containing protein [Agromyces kandeliae]|uniref:DUF333 domain-containing protein n=1 Tax=Agromyces kandeliae TaxID=2666141 RepID=A0A6L5R2N4_9MICO|nr:DUF333 domain-containing protein [Agromyces kandeliae]MRX43814.1 DUF333 domain-containing protein [Agromyces kandeliae]